MKALLVRLATMTLPLGHVAGSQFEHPTKTRTELLPFKTLNITPILRGLCASSEHALVSDWTITVWVSDPASQLKNNIFALGSF